SDLETLFASMTLADVARLGRTTPSAIAAFALSSTTATSRSKPTRAAKATPKATPAPTAKADATDKLAADILDALGNSEVPLRSMDLEKLVGGTTTTRRYVLGKLLDEKMIRK